MSTSKPSTSAPATRECLAPSTAQYLGLEGLDGYRGGGFHPVHLGDLLGDRFEVVHKLGHGGFGVVWLCLDTKTKKWRAVKVMKAEHSFQGRDREIAEYLRSRASPGELIANHISLPLEDFEIDGPNGRHLCLVSEVLGESVGSWCAELNPVATYTPTIIRDTCRQITKGAHFLHRNAVFHGDLRPSNILMRLQGIDKLDKEQVLEILGSPVCYDAEWEAEDEDPEHRYPKYFVQRASFRRMKPLCTGSVAIIDFGEATRLSGYVPRATAIPMNYAAPENIIDHNAGTGSDIWSLACTYYRLRTGQYLFNDFVGSEDNELMNLIKAWELYVGVLTEAGDKEGSVDDSSDDGSDDDEYHLDSCNDEKDADIPSFDTAISSFDAKVSDDIWSDVEQRRREILRHSEYAGVLETRLAEQRKAVEQGADGVTYVTLYRYHEDEVLELGDLLREMLQINVAFRMDLDEVLQHPWLSPDEWTS